MPDPFGRLRKTNHSQNCDKAISLTLVSRSVSQSVSQSVLWGKRVELKPTFTLWFKSCYSVSIKRPFLLMDIFMLVKL